MKVAILRSSFSMKPLHITNTIRAFMSKTAKGSSVARRCTQIKLAENVFRKWEQCCNQKYLLIKRAVMDLHARSDFRNG